MQMQCDRNQNQSEKNTDTDTLESAEKRAGVNGDKLGKAEMNE